MSRTSATEFHRYLQVSGERTAEGDDERVRSTRLSAGDPLNSTGSAHCPACTWLQASSELSNDGLGLDPQHPREADDQCGLHGNGPPRIQPQRERAVEAQAVGEHQPTKEPTRMARRAGCWAFREPRTTMSTA